MRLGTAVIVLPWHDPVLLAERAATLDLMSGGRLEFGVGKGYRHSEFAGFCMPYEEAQARFEEALEVIIKAWTSDVRFSHTAGSGSTKTSSSSLLLRKSRIRRFGSRLANRLRSAASRRAAATCC